MSLGDVLWVAADPVSQRVLAVAKKLAETAPAYAQGSGLAAKLR